MALDLNEQYEMACKLVYDRMHSITDKAGVTYLAHVHAVSAAVRDITCGDMRLQIVALLHDIIEDTNTTEAELRRMGFDEFIVRGVVILTHSHNIAYADYIYAVAKTPFKVVKREDIKDNMKAWRLKNNVDIVDLTTKDAKRIGKYATALIQLTD